MKRLMPLAAATLLTLLSLPLQAEKAVFAGGCFWCVEAVYQDLEGVSDAVSGFTGGTLQNPTYKGNHEGHYEAVEITFDPAVISYQELLVDPDCMEKFTSACFLPHTDLSRFPSVAERHEQRKSVHE